MRKIITLLLLLSPLMIYADDYKHSNYLMGTEDLSILSSTKDQNDNTIIFGYFTGSLTPTGHPQVDSRGGRDYFLAKYDNGSNLLWLKGLGSTANEFFDGGACTCVDNNIYITGSFGGTFYYTETDFLDFTGTFQSQHDIFLAKFDTDGNNIWCENIGSGGANLQRSTTIKVDNDANILVGGYYKDSLVIASDTTLYTNEFKDYFYAKFTSDDGRLIWAKALKSINTDFSGFIYSFATADDHYVISGVFADSVDIGVDTLVSKTDIQYDTHIIKTDTSGNIQWVRKIQGTYYDYSYASVMGPDNSIYISGYYNSSAIDFDSTETDVVTINQNNGDFDFYLAKYDTDGELQWAKVNGGTGEDRLLHLSFFNNKVWVTGFFADELQWGAQTLTTAGGSADTDMFYGSIDEDGNYTGATTFSGRNNSTEWGISVFSDATDLYAVLRTNSDVFEAGDSLYLNVAKNQFLVIGALGCLPIGLSETHVDIANCFGDSTGTISITATDGYGGFIYSVGDEYPYQPGNQFTNLPAGDYMVSVLDAKNCYQGAIPVTLTQPTEIIISDHSSTDSVCYGEESYINVAASGGTGVITYSLDSAITFPYTNGNITGLTSGIYDVVVKDQNNCYVYVDTDTIFVNPEILVNSVHTVDPLCSGIGNDSIILDINGGTGQLVISVDGGISYTYADDTITNLGVGSYDLYIMDEMNCIVSAGNAEISEPSTLSLSLKEAVDATCNGISNGSISLSRSGGTEPYEFTIDDTNYQADSTFSDLAAGTYIVKLIDANGCNESLADLTVNEPAELLISLVDSSNIIAGVPGNIIVSGAGGTTPYTFTLQPNGTEQVDDGTFSISSEGTYYVELTDANDCDGGSISEITILHVGIGPEEFSTAKLYPNPSTGQVSLEFNSDKAETNMEIVSIDGRLVYNTVLYSNGGMINETFDLSDLQPGIYMIRLDHKTLPNGLMIK